VLATDRSSVMDVNAVVGGVLRDMAFAQSSPQKAFGYKRAAAVVLSLDEPLDTLLAQNAGVLPKLAGIGPASTRIILEVLERGESLTVEHAIANSGRQADIERRRGLRGHVFSRAEVRRVLEDSTLVGPSLHDYHGDLQMHSEWSDGATTLDEIADACAARGDLFAAVTDHSHRLKIAGGMSMEEAARQHAEIDRINRERPSFRLIKGIEANISGDGSLDLSPQEAASFELVLAAPHSKLRKAEDQTARLVQAVETPHVHILAHPRGRISGSRAGIVADWLTVFEAAAERGVAVEIDGDPARQDLDFSLAALAREAGCLFALDSDAHTIGQLRYAEIAIAHARLASIPPERIVNCWSVERLFEWMSDPRGIAKQLSPRRSAARSRARRE
jgi:putative hydrolase